MQLLRWETRHVWRGDAKLFVGHPDDVSEAPRLPTPGPQDEVGWSRTTLCEGTRPSGRRRWPGTAAQGGPLQCDRTKFHFSSIASNDKTSTRLSRGHGFHFAGEVNETSRCGFVHVGIHTLFYPKN